MDADAVELRVLGCLIEKQRTTPDVYPLSLNSLRLACNQATNRDPVVDYDEPTIRAALERLARKGWTRLASGPAAGWRSTGTCSTRRSALTPSELAVLAVLMLRGPQTPGELKGRTERLYPFGSLDDVEAALGRLIERELVARRRGVPARRRSATRSCSAARSRSGSRADRRTGRTIAWRSSEPGSTDSRTSSRRSGRAVGGLRGR